MCNIGMSAVVEKLETCRFIHLNSRRRKQLLHHLVIHHQYSPVLRCARNAIGINRYKFEK